MVPRHQLDQITDVDFSVIDWRSRASKRVVHSTFAAEANAAIDGVGMGQFIRAYWLDINSHSLVENIRVDQLGEAQMRLILYTDCKSLFDHLAKEGAVPTDRWSALPVAGLA